MGYKHLDNEYKQAPGNYHYVEFITEDGKVYDSREINWKDTPWDKMIELKVYLKKEIQSIKKPPNALGMFHFRWGGYDNDNKQTIAEWCIGWFTKQIAHLKYINFKTGKLIKETDEAMLVDGKYKYLSHIHPLLLSKLEKKDPWWKFW